MTTPDLLPCPFCGGDKVWIRQIDMGKFHYAECQGCLAITTYHDTKAEAIAAWNTRAAPRWIPMTERKPKDGQIVAIFKPDALENDDEYETVEWNVRYNDLDISRHLWYPLPEPPKEVE